MSEENKLIGEATPEQIAKWKADKKNGQIRSIEIDGHVCYVKEPSRDIVSYALRSVGFKVSSSEFSNNENVIEMNMGDLYKKGEAVLNNCWLGGSEEIRNQTALWTGACITAGNLIEAKAGELKNV